MLFVAKWECVCACKLLEIFQIFSSLLRRWCWCRRCASINTHWHWHCCWRDWWGERTFEPFHFEHSVFNWRPRLKALVQLENRTESRSKELSKRKLQQPLLPLSLSLHCRLWCFNFGAAAAAVLPASGLISCCWKKYTTLVIVVKNFVASLSNCPASQCQCCRQIVKKKNSRSANLPLFVFLFFFYSFYFWQSLAAKTAASSM